MIVKKNTTGKILAAIVLLFSAMSFVKAQSCGITGMTDGCATYAMSFGYSGCNTGSAHWYIGTAGPGGIDKGTGATMSHTFSTPGSYTVVMVFTNGGGSTTYTKAVTVAAVPSVPNVSPGNVEFCDSGSQTFTVTNPESSVTYIWTLTPGGYAGTGNSVAIPSTTETIMAGVWGQLNGVEECGSSTTVTLFIRKTEMTPAADAASPYHKKVIRGTGGSGTEAKHYWQTSSTGTEILHNLTQDHTVTQAGNYYIRRRSDNGSCWANASSALTVTLNYTPPQAYLVQLQKPGYNEINFATSDATHVLNFADYYWVNGSTSTDILGDYIVNNEKREWKKFANGTYYVRGRDRGTGTWGTATAVTVSLMTENHINWIYTKTFNGYNDSITIAESKAYFDPSGKPLQSQTKNISANYIFATQSLRDSRGRVVGGTLPAPIVPKTFTYNSGFLQDGLQGEYSYEDFDTEDTKYNPNPVGDFNIGTVGWYYSDKNTLEPLVGKTNYPYSRQEFYDDGTGEVKRSASPGDFHRLGMGHEVLTGSFPVFAELNDYLSKRTVAIPGVTQDNSLVNEAIQSVSRDENGNYAIAISDREKHGVFAARKGTATDSVLKVSNVVTASADPESPNYRSMIYFYILDDQNVTIANTGTWKVQNLVTEEWKTTNQTFANGSGIWPAGFYRLVLTSGETTVSWTNYFLDVSYQFYNDLGALVSSVSPNGYKAWKADTAYSLIDKTTYTYNFRGWLLSTTEPDAGTSTFKYRKDGKIRFSQNAKQAGEARYSYTHYDGLGRPVESGEYTGTTYAYNSLADQLEFSQQIFYTANIKDWVKTKYDTPDPLLDDSTHLPAAYKQRFLDGAVSRSENENMTTWYSYDELGRVEWMVQKPKVLNRVFVSKYEYDFLGNVLTAENKTYNTSSVALDSFYHHYEYDADKRLVRAYTSVDSVTRKLRATYSYYLHGPLKRVMLGDSIQGIDFVYNIHGWLTQINHPSLDPANDPGHDGQNGVRKDAFGMVLDYYESEMEDLFATVAITRPQTPAEFHKLPGEKSLNTERDNIQLAWKPDAERVDGSGISSMIGQIKDYANARRQKNYLDSEHERAYSSVVSQHASDAIPETEQAMPETFELDKSTFVASTKASGIVLSQPFAGVVDDALEFAALKAIYDSLGGSSWITKTNWPTAGNWPSSATAAQMDTWYGIVVTNGDITGIGLSTNNLVGKIPAAIAQLTELTSLTLNTNSINNKIPAALGSMTKLQILELRTNQLTGGIPSQLGNITALQRLRLTANASLGGAIPSSLGSLTNLQYLEINNCGLTGTIPPSLKKLQNLIVLDLSTNNGITGTFPPLGKLTNLQLLNTNGMTGLTLAAIPAWLDSLRSLVTLTMDNCKRNGGIPSFLGNITTLQTLTLRSNSLTGAIPTEITNLINLSTFAVNNNQLTGSIPLNIGNCQELRMLYLYANQLSGGIPASVYTIPHLGNFQAYSNQLTGTISEDIGDLTELTTLDLSLNQLSGPIPSRLGNIASLVVLILGNNNLSGTIPEGLKTLTNLTTLYLHFNQLSGDVPNLSALNKIQYLQLHSNQLTGTIGSWIGSLNQLRTFRIDNNYFTGVDAALMTSPQLTNVYFTNNRLESIPNFHTYSNKANLNLYTAQNYLNFSDLEPLFGTGTHGIKTFTYAPQKKFNTVLKIHVPAGDNLETAAQPKGSYSTVTWEKLSGSTWSSVNASNENTTQQTYKKSAVTTAINGYYRWRMTNTRVTGLTLECEPIEIQAVDPVPTNPNNPALFNGIIASAQWHTESPVLEASTDNLKGMYVYDYDDKYQIADASFATPNFLLNTYATEENKYRVTNLAYDPNGNIQTLARYDENAIRTNNFAYTYEANKNKLSNVSGYVSNYTYNAIGQMTDEDKDSGDDQHVEYDVSGKVVSVSRKGVSSAGLIADYKFTGNTNNSASGLGSATAYSGAMATTDRNSVANAAYLTDGSNDYLELEDPADMASFYERNFTVSFWVKRLAAATSSKYSGVNKWTGNGSPGTNEWALNSGSNTTTNNPEFSIESGATRYTVISSSAISINQWVHLAGVRDGEYIKIYVNGVFKGQTYVGNVAINNTTLPVYVGRIAGGAYTNAVFDDIRIYNRALTANEISQQATNENQLIVKAKYKYDDRGFRLTKTVYPNATASNIGTDVLTTWYIRDASGNVISIFEQDGEPKTSNANAFTKTEIPVYGAGKIGTYYPAQDGSVNYEITDHLGNVRALVRENVNIYTATMEDDGTQDITNPRVQEMQYFGNLFETEQEDARFNHTPAAGAEYSAYLYWIGGSGNQHKAVGPAITLKVNAGDTVNAETWVRYENKLSYTRNLNIATLAGLLAGNFTFTTGFEGFTVPQTTTAFSNALTSAGFMGDGADDEKPFAYINYILYDESMTMVDAGWRRVDESMGFDAGQEALTFHQPKRLALAEPVYVPENGYIYIWVSNESEGTKVWFDDLKVTHTQIVVTQASDYGVWGDVLRELKAPEFTYRHGYQGNFTEKDEETGWNHFELREYDAVVGRWLSADPMREDFSLYVGMSNSPNNHIDPDGGAARDIVRLLNGREVDRVRTDDDFDIIIEEFSIPEANINMINISIMDKIFYSPNQLSAAQYREQWLKYQPPSGTADFDPAGQYIVGELAVVALKGLGLAAEGIRVAASAGARNSAESGTYLVYQGIGKDGVKYIGITSRDVLTRALEHAGDPMKVGLRFVPIKGLQNLSKEAARVAEQRLINYYGLQKNGGVLINQINSIARKHWITYGINP
jgi:RHS repeat-associated protein